MVGLLIMAAMLAAFGMVVLGGEIVAGILKLLIQTIWVIIHILNE